MEQLRTMLANLQRSFATLSQRERRLVTGAGAAVTVFVLFLIIAGFGSKATSIRVRTQQKIVALQEVQTLATSYRENEARRQQAESQLRASNLRLITWVEEKASRAGLELPSINPKADVTLDGDKIVESAVELSLTDIKLNRLIDFLTNVESGGMVKVKYLRLEPRPANETLTAWLTIATYKMKN